MDKRTRLFVSGLLSLIVFSDVSKEACGVPMYVMIGGIVSNKLEERVFSYAVDYVNNNDLIGHGITLDYIVNVTDDVNTLEHIQRACQLAERGVAAIVGPMSSTSVKAVAPVSTALHIPLIAPAATNPQFNDKTQYPFLVRMSPPDSVQSLALTDLVKYYGWTKMAILTSDDDYGINGLVKFESEAAYAGWMITSVQRLSTRIFRVPWDSITSSALKIIKESGVRVIILHCKAVMTKRVLGMADDLDMTGPGWAWVVTDGTTGTGEVGILTEGLLGTSPGTGRGQRYAAFSRGWTELTAQEGHMLGNIDVFSSLIADAVLAVAFGLKSLYDDPSNDHVGFNYSIQCYDNASHGHMMYGRLMLQHISNVMEDGVSSFIEFSSSMSPLRPIYDVVNLKQDAWIKVGEWVSQKGLVMSHPDEVTFMGGRTTVYDYVNILANKTLTVVINMQPPFIAKVGNSTDSLEGFCIDLLRKLADITGFTYTLYQVQDQSFGIKDPITGQWNGLIRELVDRKADLALADLTITYAREKDVDFTTPYMDLGMTFILKKPKEMPAKAFRFISPFTAELWMYIAVTMLTVGVAVSFFNKLSPNDYHGKMVYSRDPKFSKRPWQNYRERKIFQRRKANAITRLNLRNSVWSSVGFLLPQGSDDYPKSPSGRCITVLWWFGVVIISAYYVANLTAFLTVSRLHTTINSMEDLAAQTKIVYGIEANSASQQFFHDSEIALLKDMNYFMTSRDTSVRNLPEGIAKVRTGHYALIADSTLLEYAVEQEPRDLRIVGRIFSHLGYGIALQKNSPYTEELSTHVLQLRDKGFIGQLSQKWSVGEGRIRSDQDQSADQTTDTRLDYTNFLGVFYIIYGSLALSFVAVVIEWIVVCVNAVDKEDPLMPHSLKESAEKHMALFRRDFVEDWLPRLPSIGPLQHVGWGKPASAIVVQQDLTLGPDSGVDGDITATTLL